MRRGARYLALVAASSMALAACSTGGGEDTAGDDTADGGTQATTITTAFEDEFGSYNNNTGAENATKNTVILNQVLRGFWYFGEDGSVTPDTEFGTFEKTSDDPLTVNYTFNEDAVWSDGEPIDCDDLLLAWAAMSGTYVTGETDAEGNDVPVFDSASTAGYEQMQKPQCEDGDKEIEIVYESPFADWQSMFGGELLPAHIVEEQSGVSDAIAAIQGDNLDEIMRMGEFWNTGWVFEPGTLNPEITPSSGPYKIESWDAGQSLTLTANDQWWGDPPQSETIVVRFIAPEQQGQALANGEIQVAAPQAQVDTVNQLESIGDSIEIDSGDEYTYEHLDFNFQTEFADPDLRRAFAMCVPRQTIVDNLIKPINPEAQILNSRYVFPFQPDYEDVVSAIYDGSYNEADIAGARAILEAKGKVGMPVRLGYNTPNPRRTATVGLIRDSCNQAGFDVQDTGAEDFFGNGLDNGLFDVALFAWAGSPLVTGSSSTYITNGGNNNGNYSNPEVDRLIEELNRTPDVEQQQELVKQIETILWNDLATIPLYTHPGITAYQSNIEGVIQQPSQTQHTWNIQEWSIAE